MAAAPAPARVLLVEDELGTVEYVQHALAGTQHALRAVGSLAGARRLIADERPDLLLLDLGLPDGDGLDLVAEAVTGRPEDPAVLIISGSGARLEQALALGARDFVQKPFRAVELRARVEAALRDRRSLVRLEETRRRSRRVADRARRLQALAAALAATLDAASAARTILDAATSAMGAWAGSIALLSEDGAELRLVAEVGRTAAGGSTSASVDARLPGPEAVRRGRAVFVGDPERVLARFPDLRDEPLIGRVGVAATALTVGSRTVGALSLRFPAGTIPPSTRVFLDSLASIGAQALDRARLYEEARREVSARRAAEEAARWREARFRTLIENSHDLTTVVDADGTILYESPSVERILGYRPLELLGQVRFDLVHDEDRPALLETLAKVRRAPSGAAIQAVFRYRHRDGSYRWLESVATNALDVPEVAGIVVNSRDVTGRIRTEQRLHFQASLLDSIGEVAIATDTAGRIVYWNGCATRTFGWSAEQATGRSILEVITPAEARPAAEAGLVRVANGDGWSDEVRLLRRDGTTFPGAITAAPVRDERGEVVGFVGIAIDLTERRQAEAERARLAQTLVLLEERDRIAMELHDGAIQALYGTTLQLGAALRSLPEDSPAQTVLTRAIEELNAVIRDVRTYVHGLTASGGTDGLRAGLAALAVRYRSATVRIELVMPGREGVAAAALGPERVAHVLQIASEAVANALRHAAPSRVVLSARWSRRRFVLDVVDDGRGFEPDDPGRADGNGLRNMAARAALAGGALAVRSRPGDGTTVHLEIPLDSTAA